MKRTKPAEKFEAEISRLAGESTDDALVRLYREYKAGDSRALLRAVLLSFIYDRLPPRWAANSFMNGVDAFLRYKVRTLDEAFSIKAPRGARFDHQQRLHSVGRRAYMLVRQAEDEGKALTDDLFDAVGETLKPKISKNTVRRYFLYWRDAGRKRR